MDGLGESLAKAWLFIFESKQGFDDKTPNALVRSGLILQKKESIYYKYDTRDAPAFFRNIGRSTGDFTLYQFGFPGLPVCFLPISTPLVEWQNYSTSPYFTLIRSNFSSMGSAARSRKMTVAPAWIKSMGRPLT